MPEPTSKRCSRCGETRPASKFSPYLKSRDGLFSWCRDCARESERKYREANREKMRDRDRERYHADPETARERVRKYREANRELLAERRSAAVVPDGSCAVDGCDGAKRAAGFCGMHYARWKRTGDPGPAARKNLPCPEECTADGCTTVVRAKGLCVMHWERWRKHGDPQAGAFKPRGGCEVIGCDRPHQGRGYCSKHYWMLWKHGDAEPGGYAYAHHKVYRLRGAARNNLCAHCGRQAHHWAYDHADPDARTDPQRGFPYSLNPDHYLPLCGSCHKRLDNEWRA